MKKAFLILLLALPFVKCEKATNEVAPNAGLHVYSTGVHKYRPLDWDWTEPNTTVDHKPVIESVEYEPTDIIINASGTNLDGGKLTLTISCDRVKCHKFGELIPGGGGGREDHTLSDGGTGPSDKVTASMPSGGPAGSGLFVTYNLKKLFPFPACGGEQTGRAGSVTVHLTVENARGLKTENEVTFRIDELFDEIHGL